MASEPLPELRFVGTLTTVGWDVFDEDIQVCPGGDFDFYRAVPLVRIGWNEGVSRRSQLNRVRPDLDGVRAPVRSVRFLSAGKLV